MKKTFVTIGITVFVIGIALFGTAYLALAQGENIINVCVVKDGSMRVVAGEEQCKSKETPLSWNVEGQQGPQGEPGPQGEQGEQGPMLGFYTVTSQIVMPDEIFFVGNLGKTARCDVGDAVTGGGFRFTEYDGVQDGFFPIEFDDMIANSSHPIDASNGLGEGWEVTAYWSSANNDLSLEVFAICADLTP